MPRHVTMRGKPLNLAGAEIKVGDPAPDFEVVAHDLSPVKFSSYRGRICLISSVPSLDTPVCGAQTQRFNQEAGDLGPGIVVLTISMDLPFAQKRWCEAARVDKVETLSDHRTASFGKAFGVLIEEVRLLARAVFVVDRHGAVRYVQVVPEISNEPNYEDALNTVKRLRG